MTVLLPKCIAEAEAEAWCQKLTLQQSEALNYWSADGYAYINNLLRENRAATPFAREKMKQYIRTLNSIEPCIAKDAFTVRRGASLPKQALETGSWVDPGFVSTTFDISIALYFQRRHDFLEDRSPRLLELTVMPGTPYFPVSYFLIANGYKSLEDEILLMPNLTYQVTGQDRAGQIHATVQALS